MSLYDDLDAIKQKSDHVAGWSSGIKLFQSQLQLKKASQTQPRREQLRKSGSVLAPVIDLKSKKEDEDSNSNSSLGSYSKESRNLSFSPHLNTGNTRDLEWNFEGVEYDPMWPNDYEKVVKDLRKIRDREKEKEEEEKKKRRRRDERAQVRERYNSENHFDHDNIMATPDDRRKNPPTCFAGGGRRESDSDDEDPTERTPRGGGVAIAPPPSLQESSPAPPPDSSPVRTSSNPPQYGASVAAKIMAKYGFKEGQGLGKKEQGISMALQVEKTSKRGGRIIHEKDMMPPPPVAAVNTPPRPGQSTSPNIQSEKLEPSITEIMKSPSKVVLLRNMVGPREVDEELEPEVKEECNSKYGDVVRVIIYEIPDVPPEEAVRIFVEFKRIESAIKAVVDLNGRFFGGRQVRAGFYSWQKLNNLQLLD